MDPFETAGRRIDSYAAVLWDMDGTLVDTEPNWGIAELALAERHGGTWTTEQGLGLVGFDLLDAAHVIRREMGIEPSPEQIVDEMLDHVIDQVEREVPWRPGSRELLESLTAAGVPCALVTMSYARFVKPILENLPPGTFSAVVTGDRVARGKPHPEPYLTAARELDVLAGECLAIEDSDTGATSAAAAGCTVLCAPLHVGVPPGPRRVFTDTLVGLTASWVLPG
ncbi:MAG TPA: HAD family phosphatase [Nocardioides sp.]|jgi:HAD superfamily hydrolase (TIGR01509 family)|nr:HAD family phosphatase [Nocardioides sp.]